MKYLTAYSERGKMKQKVHLFFYQINGILLNTKLGNQSVFIKYHKISCPIKFSIENKKSIPTAYYNENSTGHLNMIYIKLLSGQTKQCKGDKPTFPNHFSVVTFFFL